MKRIQSGGKGKQGEAKISIGNGKVSVLFKDDDEPYLFKKSEVPEFVKAGKLFVALTSDETEILSVRPINALVKAKFLHFATQNEDEPPAPVEKQGGTATRKDGTKFSYDPYLAFMPVLKIVSPEYEGMTVPCFMRYLFVDDGDGGVAIKGGGKNADLLESFLDVTGVLDKEIPYSDNILPKLQKLILRQGNTFMVMLKGGYVDSFLPLDEPDEDELDDEPVKEKVGAKAKKDDDVPWSDDDPDGDDDD